MKNLFPLVAVICICFVSACSSIPIMTMYKMRNVSPLEAHPEHIKVAVRTDKRIIIQKGNVELKFGYKADDGSLNIEDLYLIEVEHNSIAHPTLLDGIGRHEAVTLLKLSPDDAKQLRESQRLVAEHQSSGEKGQGYLSVGLSNICTPGGVNIANAEADLFLHVDPATGFLLLFDDMNIAESLEVSNLKELPECS